MKNLEELLNEAPSAPPCGPEMTYAADFLALEQLSRGKAEQQYGDTIIPAEDPDWQRLVSATTNRSEFTQLCKHLNRQPRGLGQRLIEPDNLRER